jgi:hypothetical protein
MLILSAGSRANIQRTLEMPVSLTTLTNYLPRAELDAIEALCQKGPLFGWGMPGVNRSCYDQLGFGDVVVISQNRTGKFTHVGRVVYKIESKPLSAVLWPRKDEKFWPFVYFLDYVKRISCSKPGLLKDFGMDEACSLQSLSRIEDETLIASVLGKYQVQLGHGYSD